jgi:hypothetical protein
MPTRDESYAEIAARHAREDREDARSRRWFWVRVLLVCWAWVGVGLALEAYAFYTTDPEIGHIALLAGQIVGFAGVLGTLGWAAIQSEARGWR